jgi:acyl carrier protein
MDIESIFSEYPQLSIITEELVNQISIEKYSINLDYNRTFSENGYNDLDCIEMIMEIEKRLNIVIPDDVIDIMFNLEKNPPRFTEYWRNKKLIDLGI